jgi:hypothetical protein
MKAEFAISVTLDADVLSLEAQRHGFSVSRMRDAVIADLEHVLAESAKRHAAVLRVGVNTFTDAKAS